MEVVLDDIPDDDQIDTEVFMDEEIAEILDILPGDAGSIALEGVGQFADRLADDFEFADHRRLTHAIGSKLLEREVVNVALDRPPPPPEDRPDRGQGSD